MSLLRHTLTLALLFGLVIGLRNSHDKSFPSALALGNRVFVCDNLAFSGEIKLSRKHTKNISRDLPGLVTKAVGRLADLRQFQAKRIEAYKAADLSNDGDFTDLDTMLFASEREAGRYPLKVFRRAELDR